MTCIRIEHGFICFQPSHRLRLADGRRVFMEWHNYLGPTFYRDAAMQRIWEDWYEDPAVCDALDWFTGRGNKS